MAEMVERLNEEAVEVRRLNAELLPGRCHGPLVFIGHYRRNNPCHNCRNGKRCFYLPREDGNTCIICYGELYNVEPRCGTCGIMTCRPCSTNDLGGLCPVCDRTQLNVKHECQYCGERVLIGKYMQYDCEQCGTYDESCLECFENWKSHYC